MLSISLTGSLSSISLTILPPPQFTLFPYTTPFRSFLLNSSFSDFNHQSKLAAFAASAERCSALARCNSAAFQFQDDDARSEEHTSELQSRRDIVCRLLLEKKILLPSSRCSANSKGR